MSEQISHHIPDSMLAAYAAGSLPKPFALVVATHVSMCDECRARLLTHQAVGGAVLETTDEIAVSDDMRADVMALLDAEFEPEPAPRAREGVYPGPIMEALKGKQPRWRKLGGGVSQCILEMGGEGSVRLLHIPAGRPVPEHTHGGLELTLVLQGGFSDTTGHFDVGDVEIANDDLEHVPTADEGADCICLAATDAPLRFSALIPRVLQPFFAI